MVQFTFGANGSTVGEHDVLGDCEAKSGASRFPGAGLVDAVEPFEETRHVLRRNARSEVTDVEFPGEQFSGTPLLVVELAAKPRTGDAELLIPLAEDICTRIDVSARRIEVVLPEGLRELDQPD